MGVYVYPPVTLSTSPGSVLNPDGSTAQFNFTPIEDGQVVDLTTIILGAPITLIASLSADLKKITFKNDGGKNLLLQVGSRDKVLIGKGSSGEGQIDCYGLTGEAITLTTEDGSTGAGSLEINFLG